MAPTYRDRRRFLLATVLTLAALPALWWVNRSDHSAAPNVAVAGAGAGLDVGAARESHDSGDPTTSDPIIGESVGATDAAFATATDAPPETTLPTAAPPAPIATPSVEEDEPGAQAPVFLGGPSSNIGAGLSQIAVPAKPAIERIHTTATFRGSLGGSGVCGIPGLVNARTVTIVNLDNGRSVTCTTVLRRGALGDEIALATELFSQLADLTDAPIPVEIRR